MNPMSWGGDWAWGLPLIVLTVLLHVVGLGLINQQAVRVSGDVVRRRHPKALFAVVMGIRALLATCLHGIEAGIWAVAYRLLGALPDCESGFGKALAAHGSYRGIERNAGVWPNHRFYVRHHRPGLLVRR